ncbi:MAG: hypothetical protein JXK05_13605 [Campylobacterales bacterium]|nr:hypothetical protein [Campylobacterales bacterium]
MNKKHLLLTCTLLGFASLQATPMGLGVGIANNQATIRIPVGLEGNLRLEPEVRLSYLSNDDYSQSALALGSGLYLQQNANSKVSVYYGGKALVEYSSVDYDHGDEIDDTRLVLGGVFGFEYHFDPKVSIGAEAGGYAGFGDSFTLETRGEALLRYFF